MPLKHVLISLTGAVNDILFTECDHLASCEGMKALQYSSGGKCIATSAPPLWVVWVDSVADNALLCMCLISIPHAGN